MLVILHLSIVTDDPREKAYHLKPRLLEREQSFKRRDNHMGLSWTWQTTSISPDEKFESQTLDILKFILFVFVMVQKFHEEEYKDDKLEGDAALNKFFREIYLNSDEDMRSARANHLKMLVLRKSRALFMMIWRSRHRKYDLI
ncbi:hypothetical protein IGI04_002043 [Brassica rapa subsp. trilocularis]|uniref:SGS domain-containing protein n=1 Tax=Brassica rapa subsp. trilocularis TaxID=1813537 RepID=A0ABQ7NV82_BRACM|nr:hypothetical protein IGI04_002043 [Brassica rapa subsp. trilocularis]